MTDIAKKNMYLSPPIKEEQGECRVFDGDNPDEANAFSEMIKKWEEDRKIENIDFIEKITSHLYKHHEMYVNEMKTKSDAVRIRELVSARLYILEETREDDEFVDKWDHAIKKAKFILDQIDRKFEYLPDKLYDNPQSLMFDIDINSLKKIFEKWKKDKFIYAGTDFDYFAYAIKGEPIPAEKQPYQPIELIMGRGAKSRLYHELLGFQEMYGKDEKQKKQKMLAYKYQMGAGNLFEQDNKPIGRVKKP